MGRCSRRREATSAETQSEGDSLRQRLREQGLWGRRLLNLQQGGEWRETRGRGP